MKPMAKMARKNATGNQPSTLKVLFSGDSCGCLGRMNRSFPEIQQAQQSWAFLRRLLDFGLLQAMARKSIRSLDGAL
jgi:hypothetical protein